VLILCAFICAGDALGQPPSKSVVRSETGAKIDELLTRYAGYGFSGTVLIVKDDRVVFHKAYGLADIEHHRPNTLDSMYDIGSIAKTFTATAALQLEMRGKLKTTDTIGQYLGEFPADKAGITIHHLLTHTAGLKLDPADVGITATTAPDEYIRLVKAGPLLAAPGTSYSYSNLGYGLLALIIEKIAGQSWQTYVRNNIVKPAGLTHTMLYGDVLPADKLSLGYRGNSEDDLELEEPLKLERPDSHVWRKYPLGAAGVISTTGDLYRWWKVLHTNRVLDTAARAKMFSLQAEKQGYGWNVQTAQENARIYRGGLRGSYQSMLGYYPTANTLLIFGLNKNISEINSLWLGVAWDNLEKIILGKEYVLPPAVATGTPADLPRFAGEYALPSGERFVVWVENKHLYAGAHGQSIANALVYPHLTPPNLQPAVAEAGMQVVRWLSKNELGQLQGSHYLPENDLHKLIDKWKAWMDAIGGLNSVQVFGVSPGSGGNPRVFIKLNGPKSSLVIRLLWNWEQKVILGWGDNISMPAITRLLPGTDGDWVNFDFDRSQAVRVRFNAGPDGQITGLTIPAAGNGSDLVARKLTATELGHEAAIPMSSVAIDLNTGGLVAPAEITNGRFAAYIGQYDTPRGKLKFAQVGEKLIGDAGGNLREFAPDPAVADQFRSGNDLLTFERNAAGKVIGFTAVIGPGQQIKGTKID
jgi:CubicO group peptidase (beta-lactamase class C family)